MFNLPYLPMHPGPSKRAHHRTTAATATTTTCCCYCYCCTLSTLCCCCYYQRCCCCFISQCCICLLLDDTAPVITFNCFDQAFTTFCCFWCFCCYICVQIFSLNNAQDSSIKCLEPSYKTFIQNLHTEREEAYMVAKEFCMLCILSFCSCTFLQPWLCAVQRMRKPTHEHHTRRVHCTHCAA
jgi:hypothetical protein